MKKINIGILSPASIALHRFIPSLKKSDKFEFVGLAIATEIERSKVLRNIKVKLNSNSEKLILELFPAKIYDSYDAILKDKNIEAIYIPLPPALHFYWAKRALEHGKHILVEKPFTTSNNDTLELINMAKARNLTLFENYMFEYHSQLAYIKEKISTGDLGEIRHYKMSFGFPKRSEEDFRYDKLFGGGSLMDCGGYPIKLASILLGDTAEVKYSKLNYVNQIEVDMFGTVIMENQDGITAAISYGMDNSYQCYLEVWGSKKTLNAKRIFTAGDNVNPPIILKSANGEEVINLETDDQFLNAIEHFYSCITNIEIRSKKHKDILNQSKKIDRIINYEVKL